MLEARRAVAEAALPRGHHDHIPGDPVVRADPRDGVGDLLAVGPDVLDGGRTREARDARERLDARPLLGDGARDEVVPRFAGSDAHPRPRTGVDAHVDAARAHEQHIAREAAVVDDDVGAAAQDEQEGAGAVGRAYGVDDLRLGLGGAQSPGRSADLQRREVGEGRGHASWTIATALPRTFWSACVAVSVTFTRRSSSSSVISPDTAI